jgi:hypothetical protein
MAWTIEIASTQPDSACARVLVRFVKPDLGVDAVIPFVVADQDRLNVCIRQHMAAFEASRALLDTVTPGGYDIDAAEAAIAAQKSQLDMASQTLAPVLSKEEKDALDARNQFMADLRTYQMRKSYMDIGLLEASAIADLKSSLSDTLKVHPEYMDQ